MKSRYASDRGLTARMTGTMFLLGLLYVVFIAVLIAIGLNAGFVLVFAVGLLFAQWYFSDSIALHSMGAREVTPEQAPQLHGIVDRLCAMAEMPKPRVAIADVDMPNAFATGRSPNRSVVCVTTGLLRRLDEQELEGVLSHELSHVAHRDVLVMTIASVAGVAAGFLTRMALWGGVGRRDSNTALVSLAIIAVSVLVYAVSFVLTRMLSRYRELSADRAGALLTGRPTALASALQKVSGDMAAIPTRDLRKAEAFNAFFFAPALAGGKSLAALFATHPPLEQRLEQLAKISTQLGT
ncbi:MAG: zinc metalloprotease HtpX [Actinobacteria bacterium]|nr:zinc metalloprotease HtpX [Actinomycetota bacterium]MCB8995722.1 zinc metalloprotease HtpX [Actinomycetota bacterium]MCB9414683.1 zinc metalloprotease HtpX [Actinomycetota bacterium]HRY10932.1 zinc metalloprotease HtpX [Candidatus Nanopelagicales bacterium]